MARRGGAAIVTLLALGGVAMAEDPPVYDVAIRGGTLYTGGIDFGAVGDVAIRGDRIVAVGAAPGRGRREIDARGHVVAPGFIDLHNHSDAAELSLKRRDRSSRARAPRRAG